MKDLERFFPWVVVAIAALMIASTAIPPSPKAGEMDLYEFGKIPVQTGGRIKPFDTVALVSLQIINERQQFKAPDGKTEPAIAFLLKSIGSAQDGLAGPGSELKIFKFDHDRIVDFFKLERRKDHLYSMKELESSRYAFRAADGTLKFMNLDGARALVEENPKIGDKDIEDRLEVEFNRIEAIPEKKRDAYDNRMIHLKRQISLYREIASERGPYVVPPAPGTGERWLSLREIDDEMSRQARAQIQMALDSGKFDADKLSDKELGNLARALQRRLLKERFPGAARFHDILENYRLNNASEFNEAVRGYKAESLKDVPPDVLFKVDVEAYVNHVSPFFTCMMLYLSIIIIGCFSWMFWHEPLRRSALFLGFLTFAFHSLALLSRMYIQGRPPVTNLYSSAVFIAWGCVLFCLVLECIYKNGVGNLVGATLGASTMYIAHKLSESGDTLEMLQAVLDTNIWLATHVVCVSLGYVATYVAGFIGIIYVLRGVFTKSLDSQTSKVMGQMMYGVVCFAMLLSFVGTVLGGIWGDQSWGRFWGWDPKENGAVLVVIMNALILHARWCGMVKVRGIALLTIVGNMITTWSWFGTNQLGVGLHAYGFSKELAAGCKWFWIGSLALIGIGLLPTRYWRSFSPETVAERASIAMRAAESKGRGRF